MSSFNYIIISLKGVVAKTLYYYASKTCFTPRKILSIIGLGGPFGAKPPKSVFEGKFASGDILVRFLLDGHTHFVIRVIKLTLNVNKYL